jgi:diacylglycerol O-acyltransferase / wax synthase
MTVVTVEGYQRLSAQDASFLVFESPTTPMNVGGASVFDGGPLMTREGGIDIERIRQYIASQLHLIPRYRQRLAYVPIERQPVWIDDDRFRLDYHVRHIAVPRPGNEQQLKGVTADILSRPLDRQKPLWELWVVEGLEGHRFATVTKAHHCMVDGISGVDVATVTMRTTPDATVEPPRPWRPRRLPSGVELLRDAVLRRARLPLTRSLAAAPANVLRSDFAERLAAVWSTLRAGLRGAANTPLNQPISAYRRFDWLSLDLAEVKAVKAHLGGTVNDVVLATVAGAVRRFLQRRRVSVSGLAFRVAAPVNMRAPGDRTLGNRASVWLTELPIQERDPRRRLAKVCALTTQLKQSKQALGADVLMQVADWTGPALMTFGARFANRVSPYNLLVTNIPGPQFPLYLLGARLLEGYPLVPLFENQALGIALFSYAGRLCWGFNADWNLVPDVHTFVEDVEASFTELRRAAGPRPVRNRDSGEAASRRRPGGRLAHPTGT